MNRLHKIGALILSLSMMMTMAMPSAVWLHFAQNRTEIAATECEKKAEPANCCQGRCVLEKEIKKLESASKQSDNSSEEASEVKLNWTFDQQQEHLTAVSEVLASNEQLRTKTKLLDGFEFELLDPPKTV